MKIEYHGPHDGVEVPLADGRVIEAQRGVLTAFPDDVATSLLAQGHWRKADEAALKTKKAAKAEEE